MKVRVESAYSPERSQPARNRWFFFYTVQISNEGTETVQLVSRHWIITDATGHVEEVKGPGVVGEQPVLMPGEQFEYSSGTALATAQGSMRGSFLCVTERGDVFHAPVAEFLLGTSNSLH